MDGFLLFLVHEGVVVHHGTQVLQVAEHLMGVYHVLVRIIEIAKEQFAPKVEIVQRFLALRVGAEHLVEFAHQFHRIAHFARRKVPEQIADADVCRRPNGRFGLLSQVFVEEKAGTLVREHYGGSCQASLCSAIEVGRYLFQETFHSYSVLIRY